ncbi:MAG: NAD(P)H-hydrate dehydratase [Candidatus Margulisbacteria bacterium]|nr:NAD(P)H-hydrate dehydratase [Candidatus Margulisiibacteriota bacterium]
MLKHKRLLPKRKLNANKGDFGRALIVAGSSGMMGAAILASRGALRVGAGLTYLAVPKELVNYINLATPEVIVLPFDKINNLKPNVIAIGPGLGISSDIKKLLASLITCPSPLIIDADGINVLAKNPGLLKNNRSSVIITPHPGELARLIGKSVEAIQRDRLAAAKETARRFNCIVVLKGYRTVIADHLGKVLLNPTGNPGMAAGGVGDVLTGMIAGLIAQGLKPWEAAVLGVYLHGLAGDLAAKVKGEYAMIASDLVEKIPDAIRKSS